MNGFSVSTIDLSMESPETGNRITANVYEVDGIARQLSISELVMAICLSRATELEEVIVGQMEVMGRTTVNLESLTKLQTMLTEQMTKGLEKLSEIGNAWKDNDYTPTWYDKDGTLKTGDKIVNYDAMQRFLVDTVGINLDKKEKITEVVSAISSKIDSLNTTNQKDLITLQSMTNKRDQSYELITNMLKSIGTTLSGNANNLARR